MNAVTAISLSALAFSFYPLLNAFGLGVTTPILFALLNHIATILVCYGVLVLFMKSPSRTHGALKEFMALPLETRLIAVFSGISVYLGGLCFLFALSLMSKAGAAIIMEMWPILAIFIAPVLMTEKKWKSMGLLNAVLILLSLTGLLMITASESGMTFSRFLQNPFFMFVNQDAYAYIGIVVAFLAAFCFAFSGVSRSHFANKLPPDFRHRHFGKTETITESLYTYLLTYILGFPLALVLLLFLEPEAGASIASILPVAFNGFVLVATSSLYSYAVLKADNANINLIWYFAPLLAAIWLSLFGLSRITEMLVIGGGLIVIANIVLILSSRKTAAA